MSDAFDELRKMKVTSNKLKHICGYKLNIIITYYNQSNI